MSRIGIIFATVFFCGTVPDANPVSSGHCLIWDQSGRKRDDYNYTPGIGAHKVHYTRPASWHEARRVCDLEGGHLAIINSVAERNIILNQLKQVAPNFDWALIGFHDLFVPDEHLTVHSQPLAKAGFLEWQPGEPDVVQGLVQRCGCIYNAGGFGNIGCDTERLFVCELTVQ